MELKEKLIHLNRTVKFASTEAGKEKECRCSGGLPTSAYTEKKGKYHMGYITGIWAADVENSSVLTETRTLQNSWLQIFWNFCC